MDSNLLSHPPQQVATPGGASLSFTKIFSMVFGTGRAAKLGSWLFPRANWASATNTRRSRTSFLAAQICVADERGKVILFPADHASYVHWRRENAEPYPAI